FDAYLRAFHVRRLEAGLAPGRLGVTSRSGLEIALRPRRASEQEVRFVMAGLQAQSRLKRLPRLLDELLFQQREAEVQARCAVVAIGVHRSAIAAGRLGEISVREKIVAEALPVRRFARAAGTPLQQAPDRFDHCARARAARSDFTCASTDVQLPR